MENMNPPPTSNHPVLPVALRAQAIQELHDLQRILAFIDSHLETIELFLNNFVNQPHSDNDSDNGEVLNELIKYENVGMQRREKAINSFDGDDLAF
uniref:Uncharacterized protein n=1 Tax=Tanacetum cinerariifolium TaxID=118510 RepID=A0A6L2N6X8_TANCI|nr:hypothetical protein [Tanacetum cinerariifolium]